MKPDISILGIIWISREPQPSFQFNTRWLEIVVAQQVHINRASEHAWPSEDIITKLPEWSIGIRINGRWARGISVRFLKGPRRDFAFDRSAVTTLHPDVENHPGGPDWRDLK